MNKIKTYKGSCHCGKVIFEADINSERWHWQVQFFDLNQDMMVACNCEAESFSSSRWRI